MTLELEEAIKHCEELVEENERKAIKHYEEKAFEESKECIWCAEEHRQLADWLRELKKYRKSHWKSVNEGLPKKYGYYLITTKIRIHDLKPYYEVRTAKFDGKYFDIGYIGDDISVIAWMPLPQPYKAESEDEE